MRVPVIFPRSRYILTGYFSMKIKAKRTSETSKKNKTVQFFWKVWRMSHPIGTSSILLPTIDRVHSSCMNMCATQRYIVIVYIHRGVLSCMVCVRCGELLAAVFTHTHNDIFCSLIFIILLPYMRSTQCSHMVCGNRTEYVVTSVEDMTHRKHFWLASNARLSVYISARNNGCAPIKKCMTRSRRGSRAQI